MGCRCCEQNEANKLVLNTDLLATRRDALALPNAVWWRHTQQFGGLMDQYHKPDESQVARLLAADAQAPVAALNLFWFAERAHYQPEDPEYGTAAGDVSGREAYAAYAAEAGLAITQLGGHVAFSVAVDQVMIGPHLCTATQQLLWCFQPVQPLLKCSQRRNFRQHLATARRRSPTI